MHDQNNASLSIEAQSMAIIEQKVDLSAFHHHESSVIKRIIHTTGDLQIYHAVKFSPSAISDGIKALGRGANIYVDVSMVAAGLNGTHLARLGSEIYCGLHDQEVEETAKAKNQTRSETAIEIFGKALHNQIIAIGNAPTALFKVIELFETHHIKPALIVGVPVGFVGAKEAKEKLMASGLPYITVSGYKGGSPIAACIVNALVRLT